MNKVIDKGFRICRFVSTIVKHPVHWQNMFLSYHTYGFSRWVSYVRKS